jgi:hypothetical protein
MGNNASRDQKVEGKGERRTRKALSAAVNKVTNNFSTSSTTAATVTSRPTPIGHRVVLHDQATPLSALTGVNIPRPSGAASGYDSSTLSSAASDEASPLSTPSNCSPASMTRTFGMEPRSIMIGDEMGYLILDGKRAIDRGIPRSITPINTYNSTNGTTSVSTIYDYQGPKDVDRQLRQVRK